MASGNVSKQGPWRVVLLGKTGAGKRTVANKVSHESTMNEAKGVRKLTGSSLTLVETPGWDKRSVENTSHTTKQEIIRCVTHPPGSHALLLVLPVSMEVPSEEEIESHCQHIQLLSEAAWKYTILLFLCEGKVEQSAIDMHLRATEKLLEKCDGRYFILHGDDQIPKLIEKIDELFWDCGDCLTLLACYEGLSNEITKLKKQLEETQQKLRQYEDGTKKRRTSSQFSPPDFAESYAVLQKQGMLTFLGNPTFTVFGFIFIGAVIGLVFGATNGAPGTSLAVGCTGGVCLATVMLGVIRFFTSRSTPTSAEKKPDRGADSSEKSKEQ